MRLSHSDRTPNKPNNNDQLFHEITDTSSLQLIREILKANQELESGKAQDSELGGNSGIALHLKPPQLVKRLDLFKRLGKPFIIPGRQDMGPFIFYGGLGATGYSWQAYAMKLFARTGIHTEVYSMAGHTGSYQDLRDTNEEHWIKDIQEKVSKFDKPAIFFGYSTSLLAAFEIERRNPGTFQAIVGVGGPFLLSNYKLEKYLDIGLKVDRIAKVLSGGFYSPLVHGSVPMESFDAAPSTKATRKSPVISFLPLPTALSLRRLQKLARKATKSIKCPLFYAQGLYDRAIDKSVPDYLLSSVPASLKCFRVYQHSGHGPQLGVDKKLFSKDVNIFLKLVLEQNHSGIEDRPDVINPEPEKALKHLKAAIVRNVINHKATRGMPKSA